MKGRIVILTDFCISQVACCLIMRPVQSIRSVYVAELWPGRLCQTEGTRREDFLFWC